MYILGISCYYHDAAACIIKDGKILAAGEEERFTRIKHDSAFPKYAIDFCLKMANIQEKELDYVVFYEKPFRKFHRILISTLSLYPRSYVSFREAIRIWLIQKLWVKQDIASYLNIAPNRILFSEHHLSHAASCFFPSPYDEAAILTVDGVGEWTTASFGIGENNKIKILKEIHFPQSLGLLYSAFTAFLGFEVNEGEWKVMGLAPYGKPKYAEKVWRTVRQLADGSFSLDFSYFSFHYSDKYSFSRKFVDLFGEPVLPEQSHLVTEKSADIAASIQQVTENLLISMAKYLKKETGLSNLCLSGGVALNSVANYKILENCGFKNIYLQPACGDSGGAMGAALYVYHHVLNNKNRQLMTNAYFGEQFTNKAIEEFLKSNRVKDTPGVAGCNEVKAMTPLGWKKLDNDRLIDFTAEQLIKGKVIGWMQGRFEWGPRALGGRSILADPRNPKMKDIINSKVKFREAFRPFAPSVLAEQAYKIFELPSAKDTPGMSETPKTPQGWQAESHDSPGVEELEHYPLRFMLYVVPVRSQWRKKVPAINHADNTTRPQLVYSDENPLYHKLLTAFYKKTGVPLVLNTSFNLKGEPIVATPYDAYSTFIRSGIDVLVMGNFVCEK